MHIPLKLSLTLIVLIGLISIVGNGEALGQAKAREKEVGKAEKVGDAQLKWIVGWNAVATSLDAYSTVSTLGKGPCIREVGNPELYGKYPRPLRVGAVIGAEFIMATFLSYELKRHRIKLGKLPLWPIPSSYTAYGHTEGTIHNFSYCH